MLQVRKSWVNLESVRLDGWPLQGVQKTMLWQSAHQNPIDVMMLSMNHFQSHTAGVPDATS
jgi:hypothetical protein